MDLPRQKVFIWTSFTHPKGQVTVGFRVQPSTFISWVNAKTSNKNIGQTMAINNHGSLKTALLLALSEGISDI